MGLIGDKENDKNIVFEDKRWPNYRVYKRGKQACGKRFYLAHLDWMEAFPQPTWHVTWPHNTGSCKLCGSDRPPKELLALVNLLNL